MVVQSMLWGLAFVLAVTTVWGFLETMAGAAHIHRLETGYRLGSDRGSPNHGSTLLSKRVMALIRSPVTARTYRPTPWLMPLGARR